MTNSENIEPAFPVVTDPTCDAVDVGISVRDYFAAAALTGILAIYAKSGDVLHFSEVAKDAYNLADVMLFERARESK